MERTAYRVILAYLRTVSAKARRRILYHGTSMDVARRVLSEGLVPDPKRRSWGEDPDVSYHVTPRTSLPGVYLTGNLMTAYSSSTRTAGPHAEHAIIIVDVEEATLSHDEDTLRGPLEMAMQDLVSKGRVLTEHGALEMYDAMVKGELNDRIREAAENLVRSLDAGSQTGRAPGRTQIAEDAIRALVARQASYALPSVTWFAKDKTWGQMRDEYARGHEMDLGGLPATKEADRLYMSSLGRLSDKLKPSQAIGMAQDRFMDTSRIRSPIGFSGSNRIVAVVGISRDGGSSTPYIIKFLYGNPDDSRMRDFFNQFKERITDRYIVSGRKGVSESIKSKAIGGR